MVRNPSIWSMRAAHVQVARPTNHYCWTKLLVFRPQICLVAPLDCEGLSIHSTDSYQGVNILVFGNQSKRAAHVKVSTNHLTSAIYHCCMNDSSPCKVKSATCMAIISLATEINSSLLVVDCSSQSILSDQFGATWLFLSPKLTGFVPRTQLVNLMSSPRT